MPQSGRVPAEFRQLGITYRQLDNWCRQGYLRPVQHGAGPGHYRQWPEAEIEVARRIVLLIRGGYTLGAAARLARLGDNEEASA